MKSHILNCKRLLVCIIIAQFICIVALLYISVRGGAWHKVWVRLGQAEPEQTVDYTLLAWEESLKKMDYDADVVFLGDSITAQGDFSAYFSDVSVVNLGLGGDTITMLKARAEMAGMVTPEKVFVLVGINQLKRDKISLFENYYRSLIEALQEATPDAEIFIQSVLPISLEKEELYCSNGVIDEFNDRLQEIADDYQMVFIDLNSVFKVDGHMNPEWTTDGVHLNENGYKAWALILKDYF